MAGRTVLVAGGAGYIGSHTCRWLSEHGHTPVVYDNLERGHASHVRWGPLEVGDIRDARRLDEVFDRHRPDAVMHFAAYADVAESVRDPAVVYENNVGGSLSLLEAMARNHVVNLVFSSTCATYGLPQHTPMAEDHPQHPINPYGASKLMVERILSDVAVANGLRSVVLRYFNAAGADPSARIGELHDPETHLVPLILEVAGARRGSVAVFGGDYETRDGSCVRDYIHVDDLADAHVRALTYLGVPSGDESGWASDGSHAAYGVPAAPGSLRPGSPTRRDGGFVRAFNLGTGVGSSVFEVIEAARRVTGAPIAVDVQGRRPGDPPTLVAAADRAASELGWTPQRSDLDRILEDAWRWHASGRAG